MPAVETDEQRLYRSLNRRRAQCRQAQTMVMALKIAAGQNPSSEYYALETDEETAERLATEARLRALLWNR